jgi:hypothetical protein
MSDADLMKEIRERYQAAIDADKTNRDRDYRDRLFYTGGDNQWPTGVPAQRADEGRPCETFNRLPQFVKQVSGEIRQNKPAIKVLPVDGQTDPEMAAIYSAIIRHIEGGSDAHRVYANETEKAVVGGVGWWRVKSYYCEGSSFDQELGVEGIPNPNAVVCDPDARDVTRADMKYCFVTEMVSKKKFKREYPDASEDDFGEAEGWQEGEFVRIAEYWEKREVRKEKVYALVLPQGNIANHGETEIREMAEKAGIEARNSLSVEGLLEGMGIEVKAKRDVPIHEVRSRLVCGSKPLGPWQEWKGKHIPLVRVVGEEVAAGDTVVRHGLIHHAIPSQVGYNYARNAMMERHSMATKSPWLIALKAIPEAFKNMWETANKKNWPFLPYNPVPGEPPPKQTQPPQLDAAAYQESLIASEDMKAATGIYDAALGAKSNETSGVAIARRDAQGDTATYVYIDNMEAAITQTGRILIDLIPHYYDDSRVIRIIGEDGEIEKFEQINQVGPDGASWNDVTRGKYDVVVTTGPAYATKRQEASEKLLQLTQAFPQLAEIAGDVVIRALDLPLGDKIADRVAKMIPEGVDEQLDEERAKEQEGKPPKEPQPSPEEQAMMAEQQINSAKLENEQKAAGVKLRMQAAEIQAKINLMREEQAAKLELAREQFEFEKQMAREQAELDRELAEHAARLKTMTAAHAGAVAEQKASQQRPGGSAAK